ncbi:MAG: TonB-dependent receptor, partial [Acidobacteriota bacterium]
MAFRDPIDRTRAATLRFTRLRRPAQAAHRPLRAAGLWWLLALVAAALAAQPRSGLVGVVTDAEGAVLTRVEVIVEGARDTHRTWSDDDGRFAFQGLEPGTYRLKAQVDGYSAADYSPLTVRVGRPTNVRVQLAHAVEEVLVVATEPAATAPEPAPGAAVDRGEIAHIAADRDPFAAGPAETRPLAQQRPRLDAGSDVTAEGVELRRVGVGGPTALSSTSGVINLTTTAGGPKRRAAVELDASDRSWLGPRRLGEVELGDSGLDPTSPSRIDRTTAWGFDLGAGLFDDRLRLWGAYDHRELRGRAVGGEAQTGELEHGAVRLVGSLTGSTSLSLGGHRAERRHTGVGAGLDRGEGATQVDFSPSTWLKLEGSHQFDARTLLTLQGSHTDDAISLLPLGDDDIKLGADGIWTGGWLERQESVDARRLRLDLERALTTVRADHELRLGGSRRTAEARRLETWGDANLLVLAGENFG